MTCCVKRWKKLDWNHGSVLQHKQVLKGCSCGHVWRSNISTLVRTGIVTSTSISLFKMQNGSWHKTNVNQPSHDNSQTYNIMFKVLPTIPWKTCCNVANLFPTSHRNFCLPKEIKQREEEQQKCRAHLDKCLWHPLASVYNRDYPMDFGSGMIIWFEFTLHDSVILYIVFMCNIWPNQWPTFKCVLKFHFIVLRLSKIYLLCTPSCWVLILTSRVEPVFFFWLFSTHV